MRQPPAADTPATAPGLSCPRVGGARLRPLPTDAGGDLETLYEPQQIARLVEAALRAGLQGENDGGPVLRGMVHPGDRVVLKPNLLRHDTLSGDEWRHVITHPTLVAAMLEQVAPLLGGRGEIVITDGPQTDSSFDLICRRTGLRELADRTAARHGVAVRLVDLRQEEWQARDGVVVSRRALPGDPAGYAEIDLGHGSAFHGHAWAGRYYGASFDTAETNAEHRGERQRYRLSGTVMDCDLLINLPKLKTHKKAGITASLKNLVGVNGHKNWLPHYTLAAGDDPGDQYPPGAGRGAEAALIRGGKALLQRYPALAQPLLPLKRLGRAVFGDTGQVVRSGNWHGNDTLWRMVLDLNRAVLWHDRHGRPRQEPRRYLTVIDAILAGEGSGPEDPTPRPMGWVLAAASPVAADAVAAELMGFDAAMIPCIAQALQSAEPSLAPFSADEIVLAAGGDEHRLAGLPAAWCVPCRPHFGWASRLQRAERRQTA